MLHPMWQNDLLILNDIRGKKHLTPSENVPDVH